MSTTSETHCLLKAPESFWFSEQLHGSSDWSLEENYRSLVLSLSYSNPASDGSRGRRDSQEIFSVINLSGHASNFYYV